MDVVDRFRDIQSRVDRFESLPSEAEKKDHKECDIRENPRVYIYAPPHPPAKLQDPCYPVLPSLQGLQGLGLLIHNGDPQTARSTRNHDLQTPHPVRSAVLQILLTK